MHTLTIGLTMHTLAEEHVEVNYEVSIISIFNPAHVPC